MKKFIGAVLLAVLLTGVFGFSAEASDGEYGAWFDGLWESTDDSTKELLGGLGFDGINAESFSSLSAESFFGMISGLIRRELARPLQCCGAVLLMTVFTSLAGTFLNGGALGKAGGTVGHLCALFTLLSCAGNVFTECVPAIETTKDFMLCLIPVFTGILGFSGEPLLAAGWSGVLLAFAEGVSVLFARFVPYAGAVGAAVCAASGLGEELGLSGAGKLITKAVTVLCGFVSALFTALLSIRGIIAGAADSVGLRGLKFVIGQSVPIVGSAIGDALNTVAAGIRLIRSTAGAFGLIVVLLINLVPLIRLFVWKAVFLFLSASSGMLGNNRVKELAESLNSLLSVLVSVICFNMFVFIIGIAVVLTVSGK